MELAAGRMTGQQLGLPSVSSPETGSGRQQGGGPSHLLASPEAILADTRWGKEPGVLASAADMAILGSDGASTTAVAAVRALMGQN